MIIQEIVTVNNLKLKHIYSSDNKMIKQVETNTIYDAVYDTFKRDYHYVETDQEIPDEYKIIVPQE
ncbi:MAG: hypothetical protein ACLRFE_03745 [Clostridia bacterium]